MAKSKTPAPVTIVLENFNRMSPETPIYSAANQHYLIKGADPLYYLDQSLNSYVQEEQVAPLSAAHDLMDAWTGLDGNMSFMLQSPAPFIDIYVATSNNHVYQLNSDGSTTDFGIPVSGSNVGQMLAIFNSQVLWVNSLQGEIWKKAIDNSGSWSNFGTITPSIGQKWLVPFLDFCAISDGTTSLKSSNLVTKILSNFTTTAGIDLGGESWGIFKMLNYNNKYLAIFADYTGGASSGVDNYSQNYCFLWNGISATYNYSIQSPGNFLDAEIISGTVYILTRDGVNQTSIYYLNGLAFKKLQTLGVAGVAIFDANGNIGIVTNSGTMIIRTEGKTSYAYMPILKGYYQQSPTHSWIVTGGYTGSLVFGVSNGDGTSKVQIFNANKYVNIDYITQYIDLGFRGQLNDVQIHYDSPPGWQGSSLLTSSGDKISTIISAVDEFGPNGTEANVITNLNDITPTTFDNAKRTLLDGKGVTFDKIRLELKTVVGASSTWWPVIRKIEINCTPNV